MQIKTFDPLQTYLSTTIFPQQVHGSKIVEIVSGQEDLSATDGLYSKDLKFLLGVKTADCAPIAFFDQIKFGIIHVGWRGLVRGICEQMQKIFQESQTEILVGPFLPQFEIQKDFCYEQIKERFGDQFFIFQDNKIIFDFQAAIKFILPAAKFDGRSTFADISLASWRRDHQHDRRNYTTVGNF